MNTVFLAGESGITGPGGSSEEEKQDVGDLFGGRSEITLEETDKEQGDHKEANEQGDQNISYHALSSGGSHFFPKDLAVKAIVPGENFSGNRFAI